MDPAVWGPVTWRWLLNSASCVDSAEKRAAFQQIARDVEHCLPCSHCRASYAMYIRKLDPLVVIRDEKDSALKFVWTVRDMVNQKLGHPCIAYSTLKKRIEGYTSLVEAEALDAFGYMLFAEEQERSPETLSRLASLIRHSTRLYAARPCAAPSPSPWQECATCSFEGIEKHLWETSARLRAGDAPPSTLDAFRGRYRAAAVAKLSLPGRKLSQQQQATVHAQSTRRRRKGALTWSS